MSNSRVERLLAPWLQALQQYHVEDAAGLIKMDAMENPYPLPEALRPQWLQALARVELNRYPDPHAQELKTRLRAHLGLSAESQIVLGNGSDELIHLLLMALNRTGASVLCPEPTFAVYRLAAQALGMSYHGVPLVASDFALDLAAMLAAIERHQPALLFLASPNNPTGNTISLDEIRTLCRAMPGLVVLDEAYCRFVGQSLLAATSDLDNLVVMQTLSKTGLAGARVGMLMGDAAWLEPLERVRMPYNINSLSQVTACFALEHDALFQRQVDDIRRERDQLFAALSDLPGLKVWPSKTNFLLLRVLSRAGPEVFRALRDGGVLVKNLHGAHALLENCLRVSLGLPQENARFLSVLRSTL